MSEPDKTTTVPQGPEVLRRYYELMRERDLQELEIREGDFYLKLTRAFAGSVAVVPPVV